MPRYYSAAVGICASSRRSVQKLQVVLAQFRDRPVSDPRLAVFLLCNMRAGVTRRRRRNSGQAAADAIERAGNARSAILQTIRSPLSLRGATEQEVKLAVTQIEAAFHKLHRIDSEKRSAG